MCPVVFVVWSERRCPKARNIKTFGFLWLVESLSIYVKFSCIEFSSASAGSICFKSIPKWLAQTWAHTWFMLSLIPFWPGARGCCWVPAPWGVTAHHWRPGRRSNPALSPQQTWARCVSATSGQEKEESERVSSIADGHGLRANTHGQLARLSWCAVSCQARQDVNEITHSWIQPLKVSL